MPCESERRRTPAKATQSPLPGADSQWWRSMPPRGCPAPPSRSRSWTCSRAVGSYRLLLHVGHGPARGRPMRGLYVLHRAGQGAVLSAFARRHVRHASAKVLTRRVCAIATSWAGTCRGTQPKSRLTLADRAPGRHGSPGVLPAGWRPRVRDLLDEWSRRRGDGQQLRADGSDRLWTPGEVGESPAGWPQRREPIARPGAQTDVLPPNGPG